MKAIKSEITIGTMTLKNDRSVRFSVYTPELSDDEFVTLRNLQDQVCDMTLEPLYQDKFETMIINKDIESKSQSERIRSVLFVLWKQQGEQGEFRDFYTRYTEKFIDTIKEKLDE